MVSIPKYILKDMPLKLHDTVGNERKNENKGNFSSYLQLPSVWATEMMEVITLNERERMNKTD